MKPYPEYKFSSGLTACQIPRHWGSSKIKYLAEIQTGTTPCISKEDAFQEEGGLPWFTPDDLDETGEPSRASKFLTIQGEEEVKQIAANSTLTCCIGSIGKTGFTNEKASTNQQINAVTFHESNKFGFYSILNCKEAMECMATGNVLRILNSTRLGGIEIPVPPRIEREQITQYLNRETEKIDALIAEQQQLIELLQEKRQAALSHAVTKGLNPDAPMRDSGVEWLGEVPEHWDVRNISKVTSKITNGYVGPTRDILRPAGVPYIQATHIKEGEVRFDQNYFVEESWSEKHSKSILREEDVLIVQTGAGTGDIGLVTKKEDGFNCHALIILSTQEHVSGGYLAKVLMSTYGYQYLESIQTGGMHPHLNCGNVKFMPVPVPPIQEQLEIIEAISRDAEIFRDLIEAAEKSSLLLKERRSALISSAVTGQIDVRGFVPGEEAAV